jgi:hypothetical protein
LVDLTEQERAAMRAALPPVAEVMAEIGWTTPLNALTAEQVLTLIEVAIGGFQDAMRGVAGPGEPEIPL